MVRVGGTDGTLSPCTKTFVSLLYVDMPNKSACDSTCSGLVCQVRITGAEFVCQRLQYDGWLSQELSPTMQVLLKWLVAGCLKLLIDCVAFLTLSYTVKPAVTLSNGNSDNFGKNVLNCVYTETVI